MNPEDFILRNDNIRNNSSPLPSVSGVSRHEAQYSRVEVSRVTVFQLQWIPGSGAEVQKTVAIRKSSKGSLKKKHFFVTNVTLALTLPLPPLSVTKNHLPFLVKNGLFRK